MIIMREIEISPVLVPLLMLSWESVAFSMLSGDKPE
tara:strand:+ start:337 stop:444 length:108 start_codon:yes stop_codon:yes gene_type:complete